MPIGNLRRRIVIQTKSHAQDALGEPMHAWTDLVSTWAAIEDISGHEFIAASETQNKVTTRITIRYRSGLLPAMRVLYGTIAYNIEAVLGEDRKTLLLLCSTLV